jgi:hypothetical protein
MSIYCKNQSRARPYIVSVCGLISTFSVGSFAAVTLGELGFRAYLITLVVVGGLLWILFNAFFTEINGFLIRMFGGKTLEEKKRLVAKQIVQRLYDRNVQLRPPIDEDDLVMVEARNMFSDYFWRLKSRG